MSDVLEQIDRPEAERPWMPRGYGIPTTEEGMLKWNDVNELLRAGLNYWIATTTKDGQPHVRPVWGAWSRNIFYFDGSPETGWWRNLNRDPRISVQVEVDNVAIIIEGDVVDIAKADDELADRLLAECRAKYMPKYNYDHEEEAKGWRERGLVSLHPRKIFAWDVTNFQTSPARFTFDSAAQEAK